MPAKRPTLLAAAVGALDHVRGPADAPVTLVEYADFECPFCGRWFPELQRVLKDLAAEVAEAAAAQGKFWEMHDLLFPRQAALDAGHLLAYVRELELDAVRVERELEQEVYRARVRHDIESGLQSGVSGTPMFFINGRRHEEPGDARTLQAALLRAT